MKTLNKPTAVTFRVIRRFYYQPGRLNETRLIKTVDFPTLTPGNKPNTFKEIEEYRKKLFNEFSTEYTRKYFWVVSSLDKNLPWQ